MVTPVPDLVSESKHSAATADIATLANRIADLEQTVGRLSQRNGVTLCVFSGNLDRLLAAFSIANGAAACGLRVSMFFTFWGTPLLRRPGATTPGKRFIERAFGWMLPAGPRRLSLSRLNMGGLGKALILGEMRRKRMPDLTGLMEMAKASGVEIRVCGMSMELMGIRSEELIDYPNLRICGATQFVDMAVESNVTLFV
ncbi:MAG: DsrE/DsrF/DrsH-like family protein [Burkholderiales bacterium]|nr:DsrE/DsrF/DrsH-like family protein [Burkholderiales bacterium]